EPLAGAHTNPSLVTQVLRHHLVYAFTELEQVPTKQLLVQRYRKFRHYGQLHHVQHQHAVAVVEQSRHALHQLQYRLPTALSSAWTALVTFGRDRERGITTS
ncbi:MAG TPA: hypothetical protein VGT44_15170, partial [Ktedonobacteraceae bacterium]|nr:hypothetical protein [Ktedonobacteraceae bacterium]